mmetsp:Transcript_6372/g.12554  ORF Transcript_6372/g.12554 Transcript_6372/m.12554 type:complete len:111 (+) Transcript_6372:206-538(+)
MSSTTPWLCWYPQIPTSIYVCVFFYASIAMDASLATMAMAKEHDQLSAIKKNTPSFMSLRITRKNINHKKYGTAARGAIMVLFCSVSVKYLTSLFKSASKLSMLATLPQR